MKKIKIIILILLFCTQILPADDLEIKTLLFNDDEYSQSINLYQIWHWGNAINKIGLGATQTFIIENDNNRSFYGGLVEFKTKSKNTELFGQVNFLRWNKKLKIPFNISFAQMIGKFRFEETLDYDTINSVKSYDAQLDFIAASFTLDYYIFKNLTLINSYWYRRVSDKNDAYRYLGRVILDFNKHYHLQYSYRNFRNDYKTINYFSPENFTQHILALGYYGVSKDKFKIKIWAGPIFQDDSYETSWGIIERIYSVWTIGEKWSLEGKIEANQIKSGYQYTQFLLSIIYR
ncbi:MAG: hypothetical protein WC495_06945 [Patescibacteria group bacterium]|jgi:hypothetical protein